MSFQFLAQSNFYRMKKMRIHGRVEVEEKPLGDFRDISVYPTEEDLATGVELRPNRDTQGDPNVFNITLIFMRLTSS